MNTPIFTALRLQNFRSYVDFAVEFSPDVNIIVGPNASGKTNLLESLLLLCGAGSYRGGYKDVIAKQANWARIDSSSNYNSRVLKLSRRGELVERVYEIDQKPKKRLLFSDILPTLLFEPEHMQLITGSPDLRRAFVDDILTGTIPEYAMVSNKFRRTLAQRNRLLKSGGLAAKNQIFVWNIRLSELAGIIVAERIKLVEDLNKKLSEIYSEIAQDATVIKVQYSSPLAFNNYETALLTKLEQNYEKDMLRGFTAYGPHREDILVTIGDHLASEVASRGETRTLVISLKLLALKIIEAARGQKPLILLDDVFSELDGSRRGALTKYLYGYQTVITTTDADIVGKNLAHNANIIALA